MNTWECPKCGSEHSNRLKKCGCGYEMKNGYTKPEHKDPMHLCCSYMSGTSRCHYPGTMSAGTNGDGRFFCSAHYGEADPVIGSSIVFKSHEDVPRPDYSPNAVRRQYELKTLKAISEYNGASPSKYVAALPGKQWAYRLMEQEATGEELATVAMDAWREVLGYPKDANAKDVWGRIQVVA